MAAEPTTPCANCERLQAQLTALQARLDAITATVAQLQQQLAAARKDSSTSSKPPSSDIVKPSPAPASQDQTPRRAGGQCGHPKHERPLLPAECLTTPPVSHNVEICPDCGHGLHETST